MQFKIQHVQGAWLLYISLPPSPLPSLSTSFISPSPLVSPPPTHTAFLGFNSTIIESVSFDI